MNRTRKIVGVGLGFLGAGAAAFAQSSPAFDYTQYTSTLTTGATAVGTVAAAFAVIAAGIIVWNKLKKRAPSAG